jgi:two-component system NtrC family sensor kinase
MLAVAILGGALLTFFVLRSIAGPLRRLVFAIDGLNAGNTEVPIPAPGPDEIGAMARTLALFRDSLKELHETLARLEALRGVGRTAGSTLETLDLEAVLAIVAARAVEFSQAGAGIIYEYDDAAQEFRFWTSQGAEPELIEALKAGPIRRGEGAIGRAADARAPVQISDIAQDDSEDAPAAWAVLVRLGYRSLLAAPLLREEEILGGLVVARRDAGGFAPAIVDLIDAFATQSALAVRNAKLYAEQTLREQELRVAHEELKLAQASLLQAEKMASLGQLTAGIAHEIKNPLNFINNFASLSVELLDELKQAAAPAVNTLDRNAVAEIDEIQTMLVGNLVKVVEHGRRADGIVKSMLLHSRGSSGERQSVDINDLVEEALNLAYHGARAQDPSFNITLERDFDPTATAIELVPQDITRVLLNLFGNGFYAAHKRLRESGDPGFRPVLKAATRELHEAVEIRVRDNGSGIPPEIRDKLFQPFFTTKPTGEGTGLGLSISYDIVTQEHGGTIEVDSEVGAFTEFTVRLPRPIGARRPVATGFAA